eukprot:CCRYP_014118-RE/>CCRYP_014118-RE protein AED:0.41 eAED:1.00 QI:0/-1/0/1/-1/0/1/0/22
MRFVSTRKARILLFTNYRSSTL